MQMNDSSRAALEVLIAVPKRGRWHPKLDVRYQNAPDLSHESFNNRFTMRNEMCLTKEYITKSCAR